MYNIDLNVEILLIFIPIFFTSTGVTYNSLQLFVSLWRYTAATEYTSSMVAVTETEWRHRHSMQWTSCWLCENYLQLGPICRQSSSFIIKQQYL